MPTVIGTTKSRAFRVLWMLEELGLDYDHQPDAPGSEAVTTHNPSGKIPVFIDDDGAAITDSTAIITYLADRHGKLTFPAGSPERAQQDSLTQTILDEFDATLWMAARHSFILPPDRRVPAIKDSLKWEFAKNAERFAERIKSPFVMGDQMTIPDILLAHCTGWSITAKFGLENGPVLAHLDAMRTRAAYIRARSK